MPPKSKKRSLVSHSYTQKLFKAVLTPKPARHSALCRSRVPFFVVEKSADVRYNKPLNFAGVTGDYGESRFRDRRI